MWIVHCGAWTLAPLSIFLLDKILWHPTHLSVMWLCHIILKTFIRPKVNFLLMESKQVNLLCWNFSTVCIVLALSFDVGVFFWWGGFETISEPQKSLSALWATHFSRQLLDHVLLDLELGHLYSCFCTPWCFVEKMTKVSLLLTGKKGRFYVLCDVFPPLWGRRLEALLQPFSSVPLFVSR